uniref:site-specific DNA-methyltransferase (adenine-specific) n=1 Tax=Candidatus Kentrum sp. LFY TaxID=2126342 RepID=A0A450X6Z1_9GAMM|nr:MAG: DNA adenine methylase [Candidatus Kentron sp. LFY]
MAERWEDLESRHWLHLMNYMTNVRRPILRYYGGKWNMAPWIIANMPPHKVYVEPFAGAANVMLRKPPVNLDVLGDLQGRMINVFRVLQDRKSAKKLARLLRTTPYSETEFEHCHAVSNDPVEDARRTIVVSMQGHAGVAAAGKKRSGFRRVKNPRGVGPARTWSHVWEYVTDWSDRLRGVVLERKDALTIIDYYDGPDTVIYADPPYLRYSRTHGERVYEYEMEESEHRKLAECLGKAQGTVLVSGYRTTLYDRLYTDWQRYEKTVVGYRGREVTECLWVNRPGNRQLGLF